MKVRPIRTLLHLAPPVTFDELVAAMKGDVMASGELVGYAARPSH